MTACAMRVTVLGTGAMACLFGARLARSGRARVTLAGTWPAALAALAGPGVRVLDEDGSWSVPVVAVARGGPLDPADLVLVLVKSYQTAAVAQAAARARAPGGLVLSLQNGLGQREVLAAAVGADHVAVGVTSAGATLVAPGVVRSGGLGATVLGRTPVTAERLAAVADLCNASGLPTTVTDDIERLRWRKLAVNAAINAVSALAGVPNGALLTDPALAADMAAAAREVGAVAAAAGVELDADPVELAGAVARATADNRSSMLQDLDRGAPTEVDAIQGAVVRAGRRLGVPTPVNERLWRAVRTSEAGIAAR